MPDDGALMMTGTQIFTANASWGGLVLPPVLTLVVGITPAPFLEITGDFAKTAEAIAWEQAWPARKRALLGNTALLWTGLGPIVARTELRREDATLVVRTTATSDELLRTLNAITTMLAFHP
jgi:hypothetical protein